LASFRIGSEAQSLPLRHASSPQSSFTLLPPKKSKQATPKIKLGQKGLKQASTGNRIVVSAVVGLRDAKRLLKRLEANIALLEEEEGEENEEAAN
jgi:hypothetical protein